MTSRAGAALVALSAALALASALRLPFAWETGNALNHVSGVWMSLADDLARGTLYRPLHDPDLGYGGSRYFPAVFALQAALVRAGASPLAAAYATSLGGGLLLALGAVVLLRAVGVEGRRAILFAPIALAGFAGQRALADGRGDVLPVALSALGLAALAGRPSRAGIPLAALALTLAFAAKPTALTAAAAGVAFLAVRRRGRAAAALALLVGSGAAAVMAATDALSGGRFLAGLRAVGSSGAGLATLVRAPVRLAEELAVADPAGLAVALAATAVLAASAGSLLRAARAGADEPRLLPALWVAAAWAGALAVLATPGTGFNHLVELEAASAVLLGAAGAAPGRARSLAVGGAVAAALAGLAAALTLWRADLSTSRLAELRAVIRALPPGRIVSEDPLVPLLAGARPLLLDPFAIRLTASGAPGMSAPLAASLRAGAFAAVVLFEDLESPAADEWYAGGNLGLPLAGEIRRGYRRSATIGRYQLYLPRAAPGGMARRDPPR